jgi:hypothetical protein
MNDGGKRRYADADILVLFEKSSETARQTVPVSAERMIQSDLHGNMQSAAEMTAPGGTSPSNNNERS